MNKEIQKFFRDITEEQLKSYGIQSVSVISESSWDPRFIVKLLNGEEIIRDGDIINYINNIKQGIRKKKLKNLI